MSANSEKRFAVLIDAENVSDKYIKIILDEISNEGEATYKRIYGDWTKPSLAPWKKVLLEYSVMPVQQYSYTQGKNSSDSAMIIDAMDILYSGNVEGFCLCTSDSDFTRLATRLRESGMTVVGMGEQKTPKAFTSACNKFKYLDLLSKASKAAEKTEKTKSSEKSKQSRQSKKDEKKPSQDTKKDEKLQEKQTEKPAEQTKVQEERRPEKDTRPSRQKAEEPVIPAADEEEEAPKAEVTSLDEIKAALVAILDEAADDDDGWVSTSDLGNRLLKRYSDFDVRNYGFTKFTPFLKSLKGFEMMSVRNENSSVKHVYLREYIPDRGNSEE